jgi:hypothetical protein
VFCVGTDGVMYHDWQTAPNTFFAGLSSLGGTFT